MQKDKKPRKKRASTKLDIAPSGLPQYVHRYLMSYIRRVWQFYKPRQEVKNAARVKTGLYKCAHCKVDYDRKEIEVNHIISAAPLEGWDSWDTIIDRMFTTKENLEAICKGCHRKITTQQAGERAVHRRKKD